MSLQMPDDADDEFVRPVTRLSKGFALRDLIAGAEFEVRDDSYLDADEEEHGKRSTFSPDEVEGYINESALDLETDDYDNVISFPELRKKMTSLTSDGKIMKLVKRVGAGNKVNPDSVVFIHYSAHVNLDEFPFDNSYLRRKRPERHQLGTGELLPGLEIGIKTMKKGEKSQFLIDSDYAFGKRGCPPRIPPDATVLYEVELCGFADCIVHDDPENLEIEDRHSLPYVLKKVETLRLLGNDLFRKNNEKAAIPKYEKAVNLLLDCHLKNEEEETEQKARLMKLYTNLAVALRRINRPQKVCIVAREAHYIDREKARKNPKLLFCWGSAMITLGDYKKAGDLLRAANLLQPNDPAIKQELSRLDLKKSQYAEEEKICFQRALGLKPDMRVDVPTEKTSEDTANPELVNLVKKSIEDAKNGKDVKLNLMPESIDRVEELCRSLTIDEESLSIERAGPKTISISKVK